MTQKLVSIITPCFNCSQLIRTTYESIKAQTYKNWEWVVVDDCSHDNSQDALKFLAQEDSRIRIILLAQNSGAAVARNTAIINSKGEYLAFLDSDDLWKPNKLSVFMQIMEEKKIEFACGSYAKISRDDQIQPNPFLPPQNVGYADLLKTCSIGTSTVVVKREAVGELRMDPSLRRGQDYLFWLSILRKGIRAHMIGEEALTLYRVGNKHSLSANKIKKALGQWKIYRSYLKLNLVESVYYFAHYSFHGFVKNWLF